MSIALLCPTRARPEQCKRMVQSVYNTTSENIGIYIAVSAEEFDLYKNTLSLPENNRLGIVLVTMPDGMPTGYKWNRLAELAIQSPPKTGANIFMLCADDVVFSTPLWDKALLDHYNALDNKIHAYHLRDSRNPDGTPHPIVTREWIEAMGYFLPPLFVHWFVDTWTIEIAKANNCFTHLKNYLLLHDKPSDRGQSDETHNKIRNMGWHDRDKWVNDHCQHFLELEKKRLMTHFSKSARAVA